MMSDSFLLSQESSNVIRGLFKILAIIILLIIIHLKKDKKHENQISIFKNQQGGFLAAYKVYIPILFLSYFINQILFLILKIPYGSYLRIAFMFTSMLMFSILLFILFIVIIKKPFNIKWEYLGINFNSFFKKAFPLIVVTIIVSALYAMQKDFHNAFLKINISTVVFSIFIIVVSISEELLYRAILLSAFLEKMQFFYASFASSLCWSLYHFDRTLSEHAIIILLGLFLSWTYYRTKTILVPMTLHSIVNVIKIYY